MNTVLAVDSDVTLRNPARNDGIEIAAVSHVLPPALSHALSTLAILYAFDEPSTGRLRIGYAYLQL